MIMSISGVPGSGKTSVGKILAQKLGMKFYSIGGLRGNMAKERGITIDELNALGEKEAFTDKDVDEYQRELGGKEDHFVIEGRLSWHFIPHSFKIFLTCDPPESARRIFEARKRKEEGREDEPAYASVKQAEDDIRKRMESDDRRYKKYYGVDYQDVSNYDYVMDTTGSAGPEETANTIYEELIRRGHLTTTKP
jgi:cytidylate kinase